MTAASQQLLNSFDSLPEAEKHQVAAEILRRVTASDLTDEDMVAIAAQLFSALDAEESQNAQP